MMSSILSVCPLTDHIALPDLGPLAMENWGMITYTEKDLLCHQNQTEEERHSVAKLIAHEVAHMVRCG